MSDRGNKNSNYVNDLAPNQSGFKARTTMRIVPLGAPGSGKGDAGQAAGREVQDSQISTGDLLRAEVAGGSASFWQARQGGDGRRPAGVG